MTFDGKDIEKFQEMLYKWQRIRSEWTPRTSTSPYSELFSMADITKSCLLAWITTGHEPLEFPPPVFMSAPCHKMILGL